MHGKALFAAITIAVFIVSAAAGFQNVEVARANPVMDSYPKSPVTDPPIVTLNSPENNSYVKSILFIRFNVTKPDSWGTIGNILQINYTSMDGQETTLLETTTVYDNLPVTKEFIVAPTGLQDGLNTVFITIKCKTWYYTSGLESYEIISNSTLWFIIDDNPPKIQIIQPNARTYNSPDVPLTFTVDRATSLITYSLDDQYNTTIAGNTTLTGLSDHTHKLVVYAFDTAGNVGSSNVMLFIIRNQLIPSPSPNSTPYAWTTGPGSWAEVAPLQLKFYGTLGAAVVEGKIYFIGSNLTAQYDPKKDIWIEKTPCPVFIYGGNAEVAVCKGKIYVIGGKLSEMYDPATDTWENRTIMPTERYGLDLCVVDGRIYVIGGATPAPYGVTATSDANEVYNPKNDSWTKVASLPFAVTGYASVVLDGKIYVIGGYAGDPYEFALTQVQIYDPQTNQWAEGTPLQEPVTNAAAVVTSGVMAPKSIYVVGGNIINAGWYVRFSDHMQVFNPETGNWSFGAQMPTGRSKLALVNVDDVLYALGGTNVTLNVSVSNNASMAEWQAAWDTIASAEVHATEKFIPFGYGTITTSDPSLSPTLSPSSSIPEFPAWIIFPLILALALLAVYRRRRHNR